MNARRTVFFGTATAVMVGISAVGCSGGRNGGRGDELTQDRLPSTETAGVEAEPSSGVTVTASRLDWPDAQTLVGASDVIALVRWVGDREETVSLPSASHAVTDSRIDVLRSFETIDVIKGTDVPATFEASIARSNTMIPRPSIPDGLTLEQEVVQLDATETYVVFLAHQDGAAADQFSFRGEPAIARVQGEKLEWVVTAEYSATNTRFGAGSDGATRRFDGQTVASLRTIAATP